MSTPRVCEVVGCERPPTRRLKSAPGACWCELHGPHELAVEGYRTSKARGTTLAPRKCSPVRGPASAEVQAAYGWLSHGRRFVWVYVCPHRCGEGLGTHAVGSDSLEDVAETACTSPMMKRLSTEVSAPPSEHLYRTSPLSKAWTGEPAGAGFIPEVTPW